MTNQNLLNSSRETDNRIALAREWHIAKAKLDQSKKHEIELRKQTMQAYFGEEQRKGTQRSDLNDEMELVLSQTAKITIDKDAFAKHKAHMESKGLIGDDGVIKMEPKISMTAYKYLSQEDKQLFSDVFVHGLNSPSLKVDVKKSD